LIIYSTYHDPFSKRPLYPRKKSAESRTTVASYLDPTKHQRGDFKQAFNLADPDPTTGQWRQPIPTTFQRMMQLSATFTPDVAV
jgi:hypothetical protein